MNQNMSFYIGMNCDKYLKAKGQGGLRKVVC
jgi:hypothetical protein